MKFGILRSAVRTGALSQNSHSHAIVVHVSVASGIEKSVRIRSLRSFHYAKLVLETDLGQYLSKQNAIHVLTIQSKT